jgi:uncharacterized repeat protein (TIGR03803 family)
MTKMKQDDCWFCNRRQCGSRSTRSPQRTGLLWLVCALAAMGIAPAQAQAATEIVLHSFATPPKGAGPVAGLIRDSAGNLYGTTPSGGTGGWGVVFKVDTAGHQTVLYNFAGGADGGAPYAGVIRDSSGNFYGTTYQGGTPNAGVVYKLDAAGHETVLYSFTGGADGFQPYAGVIRDAAGNLYGSTLRGGTANVGVLYELDAAGHETVLYSFTGGADGGEPLAGVIRDSAGNLYGSTARGGTANLGVLYKLDTGGHETVLYSFTGGADGGFPIAGVIRDSAGNLYGTTEYGGTAGRGVVFKLDATGHETVLYSFTGGADGGYPAAGVIRDSAGNLYGTTPEGGTANAGVVYKLDTPGHETVLYSFTGNADGGDPNAGVIRDSSGNLYGTASGGGAANLGVVFKLDTAGHETVLYSFPGGADGSEPRAGVIRDSAGNLYGTTANGGAANAGVVFKLDATGHESLLYRFTGGADGSYPTAGAIRDSAGNLYGTTANGGAANAGVVYKLDAAGQETVLYSFTGGADGGSPSAGVIRDAAGNLYGTAYYGGTASAGVVFKVDTSGHETVLYTFTGGADGAGPYAGVIRDAAGNLYGTTQSGGAGYAGVVYKVNTSGQETVLYSFTGGTDGSQPLGGVIRDSAGNLYGTTEYGGTGGVGVVYKVNASGQETVLHSFTGGADGAYPFSGVIRDSAGNLYGTTANGGTAYGSGVVFKLDTTGQETLLYTFTGGTDGSQPLAGVIRDSAGNLYGTTGGGGKKSGGVVFKLKPQ